MGDLLSVGYGSAGVGTFPEQWSRLALIDSLDEQLGALVSQNFDAIPAIHAGHIVGLCVRLSDPFTVGTVTVTVTINGVPGTLQAVLTPGPSEITVTQLGGIDTFSPDDEIGLHLETSGDYLPLSLINLEAWIDTTQATTGGSGGGGASVTSAGAFT